MGKGRASLSELIGSSGGESGKLTLKQLPEILGDAMPKLPRDRVGKLRLTTALRNRFGHDYRNLPGVEDLLKEFDEEIHFESRLAQLKAIKYEHPKRGK